MPPQHELLSKAEDVADQVLRRTRRVLPTLGRLCLISTFIEDGVRMTYQWDDQTRFMKSSWGVGWFLSNLFVVLNMLLQLCGSALILVRKQVTLGCAMLFVVLLLQTAAYDLWLQYSYLARNVALCGGVLLLLAESRAEQRSMLAGVPTTADPNAPRQYLQLSGRVLSMVMFLSLIHFNRGIPYLIGSGVGLLLMLMVCIGYKTKLSAMALVLYLSINNYFSNPFWLLDSGSSLRDYIKYDFFQSLSVIGALILVVALGPGGVSMDARKKKW